MAQIRVIPATIQRFGGYPVCSVVKKRTAAYARVSTLKEEQESSFEAQADHYTRYIQAKSEWSFAGLYCDEGLSAVSTARRDGFDKCR